MASSGIAQPGTLNLRPLTGGMVTDKSSLMMPKGSVREALGFDIRANGPRRIDGRKRFLNTSLPKWNPNESISEVVGFWGTGNKQLNVAITDKALYKIEYANATSFYSPVFWQREYTVTSYSAGLLTIATYNAEDEGIVPGDFVVLAGSMTTKRLISVVSGLTVTIPNEVGLSVPPGSKFYVYHPFKAEKPYYVDYTTYSRSTEAWMILVDGSDGGIYKYNGGYLQPFALHYPGLSPDPDTPSYTGARTVMYFGGRLYFGCVTKLGYVYRKRIVWTEVLDLQETPEDAYQDLDDTPGQILKAVGLGSLAFIYFNDGAYYGRATNLAGLPYAFTKLDTGGVGLAGQRAACPFFDGQIFVSSDEIYFITSSGGLQAMGTPIITESIDKSLAAGALQFTQVKVDTPRQRILFGFSESATGAITKIFSYDYTTKAWAYAMQSPIEAFNVVNFADEIEYDDLGGTLTYEDAAGILYTAYGGNFADRQLTFADPAGDFYVLAEGSTSDELAAATGVPIQVRFETGDFDLDDPDTDKTCTELRMKLSRGTVARTTPLEFSVAGSLDLGATWKTLGTMVIPTNKSEGAVGFRLTGSHFRYRFTSSSIVEPYEINEITIRVVVRGVEGNRGATSSNP